EGRPAAPGASAAGASPTFGPVASTRGASVETTGGGRMAAAVAAGSGEGPRASANRRATSTPPSPRRKTAHVAARTVATRRADAAARGAGVFSATGGDDRVPAPIRAPRARPSG